MNIMMDRQLWQYLADLWATPATFQLGRGPAPCVQPVPGDPVARGHEMCFGLCQCLHRLQDSHDINPAVFLTAYKRLNAVMKSSLTYKGGYLYSLDVEGAKMRRALCLTFVRS
jgi:hypothetical protein